MNGAEAYRFGVLWTQLRLLSLLCPPSGYPLHIIESIPLQNISLEGLTLQAVKAVSEMETFSVARR